MSELPFEVKFNFAGLLNFWEEMAEGDDPKMAEMAKVFLQDVNKVPILRESFSIIEVIEENEELLRRLFNPLFPTLTTNNEIRAVGMPFIPIWYNATDRFKRIVAQVNGKGTIEMRTSDSKLMYPQACVIILNSLYGVNINFNSPIFFDILDPKIGNYRHYGVHFNTDFSVIKPNENTKALSKEDIQELVDNFEDVDLWKEKIPPGSYTFEGITIIKLFDVTQQEAISSLRYHLLSKNALETPEIIEKIRMNLRSILNLTDLRLGFATYDENISQLKSMRSGFWEEDDQQDGDHIIDTEKAYCDHSHFHLFHEKRMHIVPSINPELIEKNPLLGRLHNHNLASYIAVPLIYDDQVIGLLELGSENANELNAPVAHSLRQLIPLFTTAFKRSKDDRENQLEAIVQEKFTAIHSSVAWRFFEAADNFWHKQLLYDSNEMEEIVFNEVYPLYGQSDIKNSSTERNAAIQADMIEQLTLANEVMNIAIRHQSLPIYKKMKFRLDKYIERIGKGLGAGDEIKILDFLKSELYPIFSHLQKLHPDLNKAVENYSAQLDPELQVIYKKRKDYELSVKAINEGIAEYIDNAQEDAQQMFPHYFEKFQTDGVEHDMYIGKSMVKNKPFNEVFLQNLRLWQLMIMCEVENLVYHMQEDLPLQLRIASLILIHSNPMAIKFRTEEKRFDVDGAYNVRYEIIKKRIDKALIKGTKERLTQVDKIAIVYSQEKEADEYMGYLEYLQSINYISPNIEKLDLNDMQGVTGMKALRVEVIYQKEKKKSKKSKAAVSNLKN